MFLKSLEIRGFKSFADKTEVTFNKGITAIVGPNGSGKSNISDAVRWVLGEQSVKTLRGGKMEDVIFAGTQYRKAVGLAQVAITLDNSDNELPIDYSYVTVSRRLYRSGESEYYINNSKCRLKDIQELFMDTGIGKEGYSIIGQGKIDAILSGKTEDRRKLLEEAAGIVKFKTRKEEAERRLLNTEQNLTRIKDILNTYGERLGPLENEKNKAKEFLKLSEELKVREVNIIIDNIGNIEQKIKEVKNEIDKITGNMNIYSHERQALSKEEGALSVYLEDFEKKLEGEKKNYYNKKAEHKDIISEISIMEERINNLNTIIEKSSSELKEYSEIIKNSYMEKENKKVDLKAFQQNQNTIDNKIVELENNLLSIGSQISKEEAMLNDMKNYQMDVIGQITDYKNKQIIFTKEVEDLQKRLEHIKDNCQGYSNSIKINLNTEDILIKEKQNIIEKIEEYKEVTKSSRVELSKVNIKVNDLEKKLREFNKKQNTLEANKNILINLEKQYEGYNKTVKILMQHLEKKHIDISKSHCDILGEVIGVPKNLEIAIEIALGPAISNIITKDENIAKRLIQYLKINKIGRATFLPLNIIRGKKLQNDNKIKHIDGYMGIASELIQYNSVFSEVIQYVLGRTIIAKNLDCAIYIAKLTGYKFRIVTIDGEIVNPGGALTGGSIYHKASGIIGRKREIEETEIELESLKITIEDTNQSIENNMRIAKELDERCLNLKDEIHYENIEITKIDGKVNAIESETERLTKKLAISNEEDQRVLKMLEYKQNEIKECKSNINKYEEKSKVKQGELITLENNLKNKSKNIETYRENLMELKVKKAQVDEIVNNKINDLNRITKDIEVSQGKYKNLNVEIEKSRISYEESINKIENNKIKIKDILDYIENTDKIFEEKDIERIKVKEDISRYKDKIDELSIFISEKEKDIHRYQLYFTKYETERENIYQKLNEELGLTYAEALEYRVEVKDFSELKVEVQELKISISKLGLVNLGAIEEYKEIKSKFDFMNGQKEDLIDAREELMHVIKDMTDKMKTIFNENFNKLRENFKETFKELFKGGSADLILGEGDELSCDIEINVEPPGKKLQNINLMSGGEKVLSAIALLFAILKMKPTPFCILDEIEAALDDANVVRYAEFLKTFSNNVQFIVITHRKGTMQSSHVMYGITMQEKGVSKIVSVNLTNN